MSVPLIIDCVFNVIVRLTDGNPPARYLDMGAGWGDLIKRLREKFPKLQCSGVDYNPSHFPLPDVPIAHADFSYGKLPCEDASFDLVTCTEVFEHLENFRHAVREAARVIRPRGLFVVSTPNVLSMKARWVYFTRGFFTYFDPLPLKEDPRLYPGARHISPIPFFYVAHAMRDAGFENILPHADKPQKSSVFWAGLLRPFLQLANRMSRRRRNRRFGCAPDEMEQLAELNNSWPVLTGRTLIVSARRRPASPPT
jgi:SAM-dependent methyltransferase